MNEFWFDLAIFVLWFVLLADILTTGYGLTVKGLTEGNSLWLKILGQKKFDFFLKTAGGMFLDGALTLGLVVGFYKLCQHLGHTQTSDSWLPFTLAGLTAIPVISNLRLILKK